MLDALTRVVLAGKLPGGTLRLASRARVRGLWARVVRGLGVGEGEEGFVLEINLVLSGLC